MNTPWILVPLVAVASLAGALVGARASAGEPVERAPLAPGNSTPEATDVVAREILAELRGLRAELARGGGPSERREPASPSAPAEPELAMALRDLTAALRERPRSDDAVRPRVPTPATGFADLDRFRNSEVGTQSRAHLFWSVQDVVDRYGTPNEISVNDGKLTLHYFERSKPEAREVTFVCFDGLVIGAW